MKKMFSLALVLAGAFLFAPASRAQNFVSITGTVKDSNGIPYAAGTMSAVLVPGSAGGWTLGGQPYSGRVGPVTLDSTGKFTANFGNNSVILPAGTQWLITVNSNQGGIAPPLGTGAQTFSVTVSLTSSSDISATLNAAAPKLTNITIISSFPTLNQVLDPTANKTFVMSTFSLNFDGTGPYTFGDPTALNAAVSAQGGLDNFNIKANAVGGLGIQVDNTGIPFTNGNPGVNLNVLFPGGTISTPNQSNVGLLVNAQGGSGTIGGTNTEIDGVSELVFPVDATSSNLIVRGFAAYAAGTASNFTDVIESDGFFNNFLGSNTTTGTTSAFHADGSDMMGGTRVGFNATGFGTAAGVFAFSDTSGKDRFNFLTASTISTTTNCAGVGTGANPSVVSCTAAPAGSFSCATNASTGTCVVNTTAVTANSQIFVQEDDSLGTRLGVTCNTNNVLPATAPLLGARSGGTSFTINLGTFSVNPLCFSYHIVN